ncbi:DUF1080 domain-containing protein [Pedobacter sp. G11]|uniref:3-keto-disaccharide hydrolase n=1 Tax=Pedobacter sp. G11 TaxID=2482728 RepID=UPI000F5DD76D|nr:DUF1080 domain-containing protein [Pedobacter sp. G11]AZI26382.1 DUF1080 domain-containing protein [Pedobacter sp. G11]
MLKLKKYTTLALSLIGFSAFAQNSAPLFDGKTLKGWKQVVGKATYTASNGMIIGTTVKDSPNSYLVTEKEYSDFVLEFDVKIDGADNNSGVQTRSHVDPSGDGGKGKVYGRQVEIDPSERAWSAGIYDEGRRLWLYPLSLHPEAKSLFKKDTFNHYKVECIGQETKTWLNGKPVAYVIDTLDQSGFIGLQVHGIGNNSNLEGKKVYFKNINIRTQNLKPTSFENGIFQVNYTPNTLSAYEKANGYKLLFDGQSSKGWKGAYKKGFPEKGWLVENGTMSVQPSDGGESTNGGDIVTEDQFAAFDLSFDFRLTEGANSGVKYFVTLSEGNKGSAIGLEFQVLDDEKHPDAKLGKNGNRTLSSLYDLIKGKKDGNNTRKIGEWNTGRVVVYPDNRVEHYLNGIKTLEYMRGSEAFRALVAGSKYKDWKGFGEADKGHILLQDHGNRVSFRSIKIKPVSR